MHDFDDLSHDHMINHHPHHHHHGDDSMHVPFVNRWAPCNDDQLPAINQVGRGIAGNGFIVRPKDDGNCEEFFLQGYSVDGATGEEHLEWESRNISGGWLHDLNHTYRVRPWNDPPTFNMTFIYHKPPCCSWAWTTPAIPYCWDEKGPYPEKMVGTGVATLFIRTDSVDHDEKVGAKGNPVDNQWIEKLIYPDGTTRENFNAPDPLEEWTVNLTFGLLHGDVLVPNIYDLADILGWSADNLYNSVDGQPSQYCKGVSQRCYDDIHKYIDGNDQWLLDHFHADLGFPEETRPGEFDPGDETQGDKDTAYTVKQYIDWWLNFLLNRVSSPGSCINIELTHDLAGQLYQREKTTNRNNWSDEDLKLGGSWLIYPSLGFEVFHFVYRTAVNNGLPKGPDGGRPTTPDDSYFEEGDNINLIDISRLKSKYPDINKYWPLANNPQKFTDIAKVTVTPGGGQEMVDSSYSVQTCDVIFDSGSVRLGGWFRLPNTIHPLAFMGGHPGPHISEWDVTIDATLFIALDDKWNPYRPWEEKYLGYSDPFGHPSAPPKEMFKDLYKLGTEGN